MTRLYLSPPEMAADERERLLAAFDSNWIAPLGPEVDAFEEELACSVGVPAAAALSSGSAALHLALLLVGVEPGDDVVLPTFTFVAPVGAARACGAHPRFVDSELETWNLDPDLLDEELRDARTAGRRVGAVVAVDLYGQCAQLDRLVEVCARHEVPLVEDAAEALGASWRGRAAGSWGDLGVFSFNGNKIVTTSGGGMLVGDQDRIARARYLASQARAPELHYEHTELGFNYRLSNLLAAVGRGQLADLDRKIARRRAINASYRGLLADRPGVSFMPWDDRGEVNGWLTVLLLDPDVVGATPSAVCRALDAVDIEARPAWKPMHLQPALAGTPCRGGAVAEAVFARGVCLPSGSGMTDDDVARVVVGLAPLLDPPR